MSTPPTFATDKTDMANPSVPTRSARPSAAVSDSTRTVDISDPTIKVVGMDFILHNIYSQGKFTTFRKWFQDGTDAMLARVASHVQQNLYSIISMQLSAHSCTVICTSESAIEDWPEESLTG